MALVRVQFNVPKSKQASSDQRLKRKRRQSFIGQTTGTENLGLTPFSLASYGPISRSNVAMCPLVYFFKDYPVEFCQLLRILCSVLLQRLYRQMLHCPKPTSSKTLRSNFVIIMVYLFKNSTVEYCYS